MHLLCLHQGYLLCHALRHRFSSLRLSKHIYSSIHLGWQSFISFLATVISIGLVSTFDFPIVATFPRPHFLLTMISCPSHAARSSCLLCPCPRLFQYYSSVLLHWGHYLHHHIIGCDSPILHLCCAIARDAFISIDDSHSPVRQYLCHP